MREKMIDGNGEAVSVGAKRAVETISKEESIDGVHNTREGS